MSIRDYPGFVSGVTSNLPGDLVRRPVTDPVTIPRPGTVLCAEMKIWLPGTPIGKPRQTRRDKWQKRPAVMRYRDWADQLRAQAGDIPPAETVESLSWTAQFEPPKSWSKKRRVAMIGQLHRSKPDRDNIDKAVLDALYPEGDSGIAMGEIEKRWHWKPGIEIRIVYLEEEP